MLLREAMFVWKLLCLTRIIGAVEAMEDELNLTGGNTAVELFS